MSTHRKRWPWVLLFVSVLILIAALATTWNWVLVQNYNKMIELAKDHWVLRTQGIDTPPWVSLTVGTLGFSALIVLFALFFAKILREMRLNQLQKDFLANMTHELKTPLASLELSASLLKKESALSPEDRSELWQTHDIELQRLRDEIEQLLTTSRWEQFQEPPHMSPVDLETWLSESLVRWKRTLPTGAQITRQGDDLSGLVLIDPALIKLISGNLLDNARKFAGPRPPVITLHTRRFDSGDNNSWSISFSDQGLGFEPVDASKVFKRFLRLKHRSQHAIPGSGLGLHLALSASRAMGLELEAHSDGPGQGATFTLRGHFWNGEAPT
jgi:signal transduction histidine kinase